MVHRTRSRSTESPKSTTTSLLPMHVNRTMTSCLARHDSSPKQDSHWPRSAISSPFVCCLALLGVLPTFSANRVILVMSTLNALATASLVRSSDVMYMQPTNDVICSVCEQKAHHERFADLILVVEPGHLLGMADNFHSYRTVHRQVR